MKRTQVLWVIAFFATVFVAYYQRVTGPTYPLSGKTQIGQRWIEFTLLRSHSVASNAPVRIQTSDSLIGGFLEWKRYKTNDDWTKVGMKSIDGVLRAELPSQPVAGKLQYRLTLVRGNEAAIIPADGPMVIRFKGDVPSWILILHVAAMFGSMLLAARAGLEFFSEGAYREKLTYWTLAVLFLGGFVLGPAVQKYAFDAWWTGWPFGYDLTDNKTAIAFVVWVVVAFATKRWSRPKRWALAAAIIMFAVYLIPHSVLGSELDYNAMDLKRKGTADTSMVR